ncbi:unnamed protein product [Bursaphelenchus xylophilus]|uniref:(pine wood nematode) hypothetical protein n=1 Tax=Bursaphelenchus xylophilus TaxID=6326 RepID=A0A7I8WJG6_BURXY|nr:unnamed protein product [Bursaphelenchus xylophilus]CAG9108011.1 unnamed protein product [Bursaphelenchus xylophilus]
MSNSALAKERFSPKAALESIRSRIHFGRKPAKNNSSTPRSMSRCVSTPQPSASPSSQSLNSKRRTAPAPPGSEPEFVENVVIRTYHHDTVEKKHFQHGNSGPQETPRRDERAFSNGRRLFSNEDSQSQVRLIGFEDSKTVINDYNERILRKVVETNHSSYDTLRKKVEARLEHKGKESQDRGSNRGSIQSTESGSTELEDQERKRNTESPLKFFDNTDKVLGQNVNYNVQNINDTDELKTDQVYLHLNKEYARLGQLLFDWNKLRLDDSSDKIVDLQKKVVKQIQLIDDLFKYNCLKEKIKKSESCSQLEVEGRNGTLSLEESRFPRDNERNHNINIMKSDPNIRSPQVVKSNINTQNGNGDGYNGTYNWRDTLKSPAKQQTPSKFKRSSGMRTFELEKNKEDLKDDSLNNIDVPGNVVSTKEIPKKDVALRTFHDKPSNHKEIKKEDSNTVDKERASSFATPKTWIISSLAQRNEIQNETKPSFKDLPAAQRSEETSGPMPKNQSNWQSKLKVELEPVEFDSSIEEPIPVSVKLLLNEAEASSECEDTSIGLLSPPNPLHTIFEASEDNSEAEESVEKRPQPPVVGRTLLVNVVRPSTSAPPPPPLPKNLFAKNESEIPIKVEKQKGGNNSQKEGPKDDGDHLRKTWDQIMADIRAHAVRRAQNAQNSS